MLVWFRNLLKNAFGKAEGECLTDTEIKFLILQGPERVVHARLHHLQKCSGCQMRHQELEEEFARKSANLVPVA